MSKKLEMEHAIVLALDRIKSFPELSPRTSPQTEKVDGSRNFQTDPIIDANTLLTVILDALEQVEKALNYDALMIKFSAKDVSPLSDPFEKQQQEVLSALISLLNVGHPYLQEYPESELDTQPNKIKRALRTMLLGVHIGLRSYRIGKFKLSDSFLPEE